MAFRNFIYAENEENLSFLPKEPSYGLGNGSLSVSVNTDPLSVDAEPSLKLAEDTVDSWGSYKPEDFLDNAVNSRSQELLQVIEKIRGEFTVMKQREGECEELRSKCEAAMTDFEKNPTVVAIREKMSTLSIKAKVHKANLDRMADKARLEAVEASLKKEVDDVKRDKMRCDAFEQVADMKEPFDLLKVKGYCPSYKKEHTQAGNELATASFPWLSEFVADPSSPIEVLLSKKPLALQRHVPLKTQVLVPASQRATPSSTPTSNLMIRPTVVSSVQP
uniref:Uncharacterized protein n=1 Tax=Tanacetum cinerariifolium TaxID=118510 RepID=A0A6L2JAW7_TANCI|nr:hypothetical protein [Tanacetum cinerariifolium]